MGEHGRAGAAAPKRRVRVALLNDYEVMARGLEQMLEPHADRLVVVDAADAGRGVDVALYDHCLGAQDFAPPLPGARDRRPRVVLYSWHVTEEVAQAPVERGFAGCVSKAEPTAVVVAALEQVAAGGVAVTPGRWASGVRLAAWWQTPTPDLNDRELQVLDLIARGLSNDEVATTAFLSINTVKSYIRSAYRKMGVSTRSQAVVWAAARGLGGDRPTCRCGVTL